MLINIGVGFSFLIVLLILIMCFFSQKRISKYENTIFIWQIFLTATGLLIETFIYVITIYRRQELSFLLKPLVVSLFIYYVVWMFLFVLYNLFLLNTKKRINKGLLISVYGIFIIASIFLPFELEITDLYFYPHGIATYAQYIFVSIGFTIIMINSLNNIKILKSKKFIPLIVCMILGIITSILQYFRHEFMFVVPSHAIAVMLMYFTIENPDLKMLNEYIKNKELVESSAEEKSNVLFKVSQEVINPLRKISLLGNSIISSSEVDEMHDSARNIVNISNNASNIINNVLDVTVLDKSNIKIVDTTYNIYNLFGQIIYFGKEKADNVEFKYSINNGIPKELHGDSTRLKQIICSILYNSFNNTENGYIDLDITNIIKYNICRLIITISDTGKGMSLEAINNILEDTSEINKDEIEQFNKLDINLKLVKKLIDIQGGSMMISSDERGTIFTVVLDQSFEDKNDLNYINDAAKDISNKRRVLIVDDDYTELTELTKEFKRNNFNVVTTMYGKDCVDKIANNEKYDYIIIDDEMDGYNAVYTIKELEKVCDVSKLKVIILLGKDKESIKEHYLEDYPFKDYLLKSNYKEEINRIK